MTWWQIVHIVYFGINLIIAIDAMIRLVIDGVDDPWWLWALWFVNLIAFGIPIMITYFCITTRTERRRNERKNKREAI